MPHKRRSRVIFNPKLPGSHRGHFATGGNDQPPSVCVKSDHGTDMENTLADINPLPPPPPPPAPLLAPSVQELKASHTVINKYAIPQYNTTVRKHQEFDVLQTMPIVIRTQLTPRSKAAIAPTVTQKMNFAPNCAVFKDLTPLNVNDSMEEKEWFKTNASREVASKINSEDPQLEDYLEKIEHVQLVMPEPELQLEFPLEEFDFLQAYNRVYDFK